MQCPNAVVAASRRAAARYRHRNCQRGRGGAFEQRERGLRAQATPPRRRSSCGHRRRRLPMKRENGPYTGTGDAAAMSLAASRGGTSRPLPSRKKPGVNTIEVAVIRATVAAVRRSADWPGSRSRARAVGRRPGDAIAPPIPGPTGPSRSRRPGGALPDASAVPVLRCRRNARRSACRPRRAAAAQSTAGTSIQRPCARSAPVETGPPGGGA